MEEERLESMDTDENSDVVQKIPRRHRRERNGRYREQHASSEKRRKKNYYKKNEEFSLSKVSNYFFDSYINCLGT